jgi:hypothetical protein
LQQFFRTALITLILDFPSATFRFVKLKDLQASAKADPNCSTFNFAQPYPKPAHHPKI